MQSNTVGDNDFSHLLTILRESVNELGIELPPELSSTEQVATVVNVPTPVIENHVNTDDIEELEIVEDIDLYDSEELSWSELVSVTFKSYGVNGIEDVREETIDVPIFMSIFISVLDKLNYNYEIKVGDPYPNDLNIILYFKNKTISNGYNTHNLHSIFINLRLLFHRMSYTIKEFTIKRSVITLGEQNKNYCHSHAKGYNFEFQKTCLGEGIFEKYNKAVSIDFIDTTKQGIELEALSLFNAIETWIEWESAEGTPYQYIDKIYMPTEQFQELTYGDSDTAACLHTFSSLIDMSLTEAYCSFSIHAQYFFTAVANYIIPKMLLINDNIFFDVQDNEINEYLFYKDENNPNIKYIIKNLNSIDTKRICQLEQYGLYYSIVDVRKALNNDPIIDINSSNTIEIVSKTPSRKFFKGKEINNIVIKNPIVNNNLTTCNICLNPKLLKLFKDLIVLNYHKQKIII